MAAYDHKKIEKKWQERWESSKAFRADDDSKKEKLYVLDMFPYPSGAGLHVGHVEGYTATDIYSRYQRMRGFNVLHPMGWDAFGLPAENYAIKTGTPPAKTTGDAINTFRAQIKALGLSYDWEREIGTHTPEYYKWTQWFFLFLYNNGLAYKKKAKVNWDPIDQTVLANEQVLPDGTAERSGAKVVQKDLEQWFFKITDFADALVDDLDQVDWPESTKINQRNWIGRSEGAEIDFPLTGYTNGKRLTVFTTRPDTLFGATYMVLAPENPWLAEELAGAKSLIKNKDEVEKYIEQAKNKTDIERQEEAKDKTGVEVQGVRAINPATKEEIPIYVADYVLGGYGTGAIMAVPAHDDRDMAFAKKFNLPVHQVVAPHIIDQGNPPRKDKRNVPRVVVQGVVKHWKDDSVIQIQWKGRLNWKTFVIGGAEEGETMEEAIQREVREETGYKNFKSVQRISPELRSEWFAEHKDENRYAHMHIFLLELADGERDEMSEEEKAKHEVAWVPSSSVPSFSPVSEIDFIVRGIQKKESPFAGEGILINSGDFSELPSEEAKIKITEAVGGRMVKTYRLRDWLLSRQRYWGAPIPVVYDPEGNAHPIPEEHLPWMLPTDVEFKPTGTSPLGQSKELLERTEKIFGKGWRPEVDTMDTFVCSSWYFFRFADPKNSNEFASKEAIQKWLPVDLYMGGAEHTVLHLMYARFFTKALKKYGHIDFNEPFLKLRHQGTILAEDGTKMSKSKGNVINPDEVISRYGADSLRLYEMFMGPLEAMKPWNTQNILGVRRFLERVWKLEVGDAQIDAKTETLLHQTIKKIGDDIEQLKFNTAISSLMILLNALEALENVPSAAYKIFLQLLAPLAPHVTSEMWEKAGFEGELAAQSWPSFDAAKIVAATVPVAVQVNGKLRATIELSPETGEEEALAAARNNPAVAKWLSLGKEVKAVYVAGKIVSFVVSPV